MTFWPDRTDLDACIAELLDTDQLLDRVRALLPVQAAPSLSDPDLNGAGSGGGGKKAAAVPIPWNDQAADYVLTVHAEARTLERNLTLLVHRSARFRGGSDANTATSLRGLPDLVMLAAQRYGRDCGEAVDAVKAITRWPRQARAILDEARAHEVPWTAAPGRLSCPHCGRRLQLRPGWERHAESADLWCRRCPVALEGDEVARPDRSWPADAWIAVLQQPKGA